MPDKYGVGLGRNALATQYLGVQRPKKRKRSKDPMFIEFDAYDAQDGLMDEHNLNDIAKARRVLRSSVLRKDRDGDGDGFINDGKPNMRPVAVDSAVDAVKSGLKGASKTKKDPKADVRARAKARLKRRGEGLARANLFLERARAEEPRITADISSAVETAGGEMYGLDFRLKEVSSLARKIVDKARDKSEKLKREVTLEESAASIADAVRYTAIVDEPPPGGYVRGIANLLDSLESKGYKILELETHWERGDAYNGVHIVAEDKSGTKFELQFHTTASVKAKFATHPLYEEMRKADTTEERRRELVYQMIDIADAAEIPQGAIEVDSIRPFGEKVKRPPEPAE